MSGIQMTSSSNQRINLIPSTSQPITMQIPHAQLPTISTGNSAPQTHQIITVNDLSRVRGPQGQETLILAPIQGMTSGVEATQQQQYVIAQPPGLSPKTVTTTEPPIQYKIVQLPADAFQSTIHTPTAPQINFIPVSSAGNLFSVHQPDEQGPSHQQPIIVSQNELNPAIPQIRQQIISIQGPEQMNIVSNLQKNDDQPTFGDQNSNSMTIEGQQPGTIIGSVPKNLGSFPSQINLAPVDTPTGQCYLIMDPPTRSSQTQLGGRQIITATANQSQGKFQQATFIPLSRLESFNPTNGSGSVTQTTDQNNDSKTGGPNPLGVCEQHKGKRKQCHNEVEKRRRDKINQWITKLASYLPDHTEETGGLSKGVVLEKAVDFVGKLRDTNRELMETIQHIQKGPDMGEVDLLREQVRYLTEENKLLRNRLKEENIPVPVLSCRKFCSVPSGSQSLVSSTIHSTVSQQDTEVTITTSASPSTIPNPARISDHLGPQRKRIHLRNEKGMTSIMLPNTLPPLLTENLTEETIDVCAERREESSEITISR